MHEDRLTDIETRLAYQEKTIKELNDVIFEQQKEIDRLRTLCDKLVKMGREQAQLIAGIDVPANEKPPHY